MAEEKILVVDDDVGMLTLLRHYLTRAGYDVTTAPSAETALHLLEEHEVAAVLTDLRMPGMDGMGLVRAIHATRPDTQETMVLPEHTLNLEAITQSLVGTALQQTHGHKGQAAALLGIHPRTLTRMVRRYGMPDDL